MGDAAAHVRGRSGGRRGLPICRHCAKRSPACRDARGVVVVCSALPPDLLPGPRTTWMERRRDRLIDPCVRFERTRPTARCSPEGSCVEARLDHDRFQRSSFRDFAEHAVGADYLCADYRPAWPRANHKPGAALRKRNRVRRLFPRDQWEVAPAPQGCGAPDDQRSICLQSSDCAILLLVCCPVRRSCEGECGHANCDAGPPTWSESLLRWEQGAMAD